MMSFFLQTPFWGLVGLYVLLIIGYAIYIFPYLHGFIGWSGDADCEFKASMPHIPPISFLIVMMYMGFQIKKKDVIYATLLLIGALFPVVAVLLFLPYQAYLLRHKNKMIAVLCLLAFAVLMYCKAWYLDFL